MRRVKVRVSGIVQGVGFRFSARWKARELGIKGYAKNLADGKVEVVAEGKDEKVEAFLNWCKKGPPGAHVDSVEVIEEIPTGEFHDFEIKYW